MKISSLATFLLCSSAAMAHYTLDYPPSRGFIDESEPKAPCGGFDAASTRSEFPLSKGFVAINSGHVTAKVNINIAFGNNPSTADFTKAGEIPAAKAVAISHPDRSCLPLDLSSFAGAKDKTNATIQLIYDGGDSPLYQCADVILVSTASSFDQTKCVNDHTSAAAAVSVKGAATAAAALMVAALVAL